MAVTVPMDVENAMTCGFSTAYNNPTKQHLSAHNVGIILHIWIDGCTRTLSIRAVTGLTNLTRMVT